MKVRDFKNKYGVNIIQELLEVRYESSRIPGIDNQSNLSLGANCQVFAYEFLKVNDIEIPNFRSRELWEDEIYTKIVKDFKPLDLMLYSKDGKSFGAHLAVYIGFGDVIHLSADNRVYEIIEHENIIKNQKYKCFVGAKRVLGSKK
jgi:hypothetical protein